MSVIDVTNCTVRLGETEILSAIDCSVERGEFVGLVGPNGAGKTTLLRTISGAIEPTDGTVSVDGVDVHAVSSRAASQRIATVPQDTNISFSFPVRDVVAMGRYPHRSRFSPPSPADRELVDDALERTETAQFADRQIDEVSGGERQRVLLARAIAQDTPVMLLDEPTGSLDVNHQIETLELVSQCAGAGTAVVAAIHDLDLAARYCDQLFLLADGVIEAVGTPESVLTSETIGRTFDTTAVVAPNPVTGTETVTTLPRPMTGAGSLPVHVLGTGQTAAQVLARLGAAPGRLTAGPVVPGSVAAETAARLGIDVIEAAPFAPPDDPTMASLRDAMTTARVTIVADPATVTETPKLRSLLADPGEVVVVTDDPTASPVDPALAGAPHCRPRNLATVINREVRAARRRSPGDD